MVPTPAEEVVTTVSGQISNAAVTVLQVLPLAGVESAGGLSRGQKILLVVVTSLAGITTVGLIAHYFRRQRNIPSSPTFSSSLLGKGRGADIPDGVGSSGFALRLLGRGHSSSTSTISPQLPGNRRSGPSSILTQSTLVSNSVLDLGVGQSGLNCTQLGILGMETLQKSVSFWEESLQLLKQERDASLLEMDEDDENNVSRTIAQLQPILEAAKQLQHLAQELYLDEGSVLYAESEHGGGGSLTSYDRRSRLRSVGSVDSFMSAEDWLSDDEDILQSLDSAGFQSFKLSESGGQGDSDGTGVRHPLFEHALQLVEAGAVPYRSLKTEMVGCTTGGDHEYLAKLHCLRGAFSKIISNPDKRQWIMLKGKQVFCQLLIKADKDPTEFESSYDEIVNWSQESGNWGLIDNELKDRGLRALTFYDIVLDYIFLDAFEDLESPPASVLAVTQNRWLSNSFKKSALGTAVWSVLKTKRKWLRYSDGFMAHFYTLSEQIMPTLAWGFLGPTTTVQEICFFFKDKFLEFLNAIFSFQDVRYTTLDELAEDVMKRLEVMQSLISHRIAQVQTPK